MSAETLRRAAALMRERAEAAHPGPWEDRSHRDYGWVALYDDETNIPEGESLPSMEPGGSAAPADAAHIASWHPAVALAVADMLTGASELARIHGSLLGTHNDTCPVCGPVGRALAVARAYLGESA